MTWKARMVWTCMPKTNDLEGKDSEELDAKKLDAQGVDAKPVDFIYHVTCLFTCKTG